MALEPDFFVGEHGDPITIAMPFDPSGYDLTIEVQKPGPGFEETTWSGGFSSTSSSVSRTVQPGELDVPGLYRCAVIATTSSPARERRVRFELRVDDATPR
jgi:hypothetical protein